MVEEEEEETDRQTDDPAQPEEGAGRLVRDGRGRPRPGAAACPVDG